MNLKFLAAVSIVFLAAGCVGPQSSGVTIADRTLKNDVNRMVGVYEGARGGSNQPQLIATQPLRKKEANKFTEFWTFNSNGNEVVYLTTFTTSPQGGTDYSVSFFGYRFLCTGGVDCLSNSDRVCGNKKLRWGNPYGEFETAPVTMRDEKGRVIMIVSC
jgi:hypothetical protein